jgi:hypothetical protein
MTRNNYEAPVEMMLSRGIILDRKMVYLDVRPPVTYPTVEVRISDIPATVQETALLGTLVRATVVTAFVSPPQHWPGRHFWAATRRGVTLTGQKMPAQPCPYKNGQNSQCPRSQQQTERLPERGEAGG